MRSILFISADKKRSTVFETVIGAFSDHHCETAVSASETANYLQENGVDTVLVDISNPIKQLHLILETMPEQFPHTYVIFMRGTSLHPAHRNILRRGHGSFAFPKNSSEFQRFIYRLDKQYPVPITEDISIKSQSNDTESLEESVEELFLTVDETVTQESLVEQLSEKRSLVKHLLRRINSPFYGIPTEVTSVERAVRLLGVQGVVNLFNEVISMEKVA